MLSPRFVKFLKGLEKNNTKEWFDAHRDEYEADVKEPFRELVQAVIDRAADVDGYYDCTSAQAVFRINRDIRFSKDKTPYKTNVAAVIGAQGRKSNPGFYMHIDATTASVGGGAYELDKDQLDAIRGYVMNHPSALPTAIANKNFSKLYHELRGEKNKILPPLYKEAAEKNPYLSFKQFYFMAEIPTKELVASEKQDEIIFAYFLAAIPVNNVLREALGR